MRCADCSKLRTEQLDGGAGPLLKENFKALKESADAGCDLCTLWWTRLVQRYNEKGAAGYLRGFEPSGKEIDDPNVYLSGMIRPSKPQPGMFASSSEVSSGNSVWINLGIRFNLLVDLSIFADPGLIPPFPFRLFPSPPPFVAACVLLPTLSRIGTPASHVFCETWTTVDRNPGYHIGFVQHFMHHCQTRHKLCSSPFFNDAAKSELPTRLIDLGESQDRKQSHIVTTRKCKIQSPYLALSYCWGASPKRTTVLQDDNLEELHSCIVEEQLSKTHRDMFQLARDLGFRYVWIDALCIIQGNAEDWEYESKRMAQVYGNAALTIVAGRAADSSEGFLENKFRPVVGPCAVPFNDEDTMRKLGLTEAQMGNIWMSLPRSGMYGPVSERGWCFQELLLSSRALIFGKEQLTFQCQELIVQEDGSPGRPIPYRIRNPYDRGYVVDPESKTLGAQKLDDHELVRRWLVFWYKEVISLYTLRKLTNKTDVFAAISGLAQITKTKIRSRYLAGLWETDMLRGLMWAVWPKASRTAPPRRRVTTISPPQGDADTQARVVPVKAPSWSWAAIEGYVRFNAHGRYDIKYHESNWLVRPKYEGRWTRGTACHATAAHIESCELEFFGRPRRVRCLDNSAERSEYSDNFPDSFSLSTVSTYRCYVNLAPMQEDGGNDDKAASDHIVARAAIDVPEETAANFWCLLLTKYNGLILTRDGGGRFRRLGVLMKPKNSDLDVEWMMSGQEEEVCLV
ncbi:hypothetical protein GQX73_g6281 [Xylaria multiplex]|uniref:Heterokaryon incompatibility domain-containing protein n=1 Tax=Xylaria multiplex TaxID=323545 RepID=A0A7C8MWH7_9PEZI|nr:hypothetical protein GQX73_g6281 [Xylaria multiplex]